VEGMIAKNEFADVQFKACEYEDGTPYVGTHENGPKTNLVLNEKLSLSLQLKKGTSFEEAQTIVSYLNQHITRVAATIL
jgi:hypothetical protein